MMHRSVGIAIILALCACRSASHQVTETATGTVIDESAWVPRPAVIRLAGEPGGVFLPDSASAGIPFAVEFITFGGGCVREDSAEVHTEGLVTDIRAWQRVPPEGARVPCTRELRMTRRRVPVTFMEAGIATIRVRGLAQPGDSAIIITRALRIP